MGSKALAFYSFNVIHPGNKDKDFMMEWVTYFIEGYTSYGQ